MVIEILLGYITFLLFIKKSVDSGVPIKRAPIISSVDFSLCPYRAAIMRVRVWADTLLFHPLMAEALWPGTPSCPGRA